MPVITNPTQEMLDQARAAYHSLLIGTSPRVVVEVDGSRVEFTAANKAYLAAYIEQLEQTLAGLTDIGPMGFFF